MSTKTAVRKPHLLNYICTILLVGLLLGGCSTLTSEVPLAEELSPELETTAVLSLRGNPSFSETQLPAEARLWYKRMWAAIKRQATNSANIAATGDINLLGRKLNFHVTTLLTVFRITGDLRILDDIDRVMQIARGQLQDYNNDGFLNWRQLNKSANPKYYNDDYHVMNEMLTHAMVASVAYAFKANADLDSRYAERAKFWTNYLKNHFEAKWRRRNNTSTAYTFLTWKLSHPYTQFIRYHYYMNKLTGEEGYHNEALKMASEVDKHVRQVSTAKGTAFVWAQSMSSTSTSTSLMCQPRRYAQITMQAAEDLALEGFAQFGQETTMKKYAASLSEFIMNDGANSFATDICGDVDRAGLKSDPKVGYLGSPGGRATPSQYALSPFSTLGRWDSTGKVVSIAQQVYQSTESRLDDPQRLFIPAALVSFLLR
jgi:hypothetical protein